MTVGTDVEATLFGGLGRDGKNESGVPFGNTVEPFVVGNVGDPKWKERKIISKIDFVSFLYVSIENLALLFYLLLAPYGI